VEYLPGPELKREGGLGKNTEQKWQARNKPIASTLCKELQATAYTSHEVPLREALGHPQHSWENCSIASRLTVLAK